MSEIEPEIKRTKCEENGENTVKTCKHFVQRKKRFCRLFAVNGKDYCGEHLPVEQNADDQVEEEGKKNRTRIPCPLDPKHTVYARNLQKHLKICNAVVRDEPEFIVRGLNAGPVDDSNENSDFRLSEIEQSIVDRLTEKVNQIYEENNIDSMIEELRLNHSMLDSELSNDEYGSETRKHLIQTSSILGYLNHYELLCDDMTYIEYGAGKGQVAYWLAQIIVEQKNSSVLLIDRASLRHKKDNKLNETHTIHRIRADISDFDMTKHELIVKSKRIVGMGKHLCGAATDFAIRCVLHGNENVMKIPKTEALIIALCCHHRCDWAPFVGKDFFTRNGFSVKDFIIISKMVGWAICGNGMSRERRKEIEAKQQHDETFVAKETNDALRQQRRRIGQKCKRLIDFARIEYLQQNGYQCYLKSYVSEDVTLENICLVALLKE